MKKKRYNKQQPNHHHKFRRSEVRREARRDETRRDMYPKINTTIICIIHLFWSFCRTRGQREETYGDDDGDDDVDGVDDDDGDDMRDEGKKDENDCMDVAYFSEIMFSLSLFCNFIYG